MGVLSQLYGTPNVYWTLPCLPLRTIEPFKFPSTVGRSNSRQEFNLTMTPSPRRWNRTTLISIRYGFEARTPDHWRSSGRR
ncbi:hypothetical protein CEXT_354361 [Caerostris extrusa]|uniref:Uncharacterized protein n=1 Tax=Caerostris extrusa TaxID=172846 RepID=A0AAV4Y4S4_CAEEX|nr:hypothetical protein CEXT_354361 [Caerostris extrusa]